MLLQRPGSDVGGPDLMWVVASEPGGTVRRRLHALVVVEGGGGSGLAEFRIGT